ncbi:MAG: YgiQ family radical SAM protein [Planctomycetaceae bacterium]|jgi:uncharacterized radical SAM protein YgiQ|nr:YgiQ family radical SAM protein [Planctomycetaceae bacterium]
MSQSQLLPISREDMLARGWDEIDVVFVTGDAYVDHPAFAAAVLSRLLEAEGFRVGVISQPDWHSADAWKVFGAPRIAFCISAGNMDSMVNHYTANRKVRNSDAFSPNGVIGLRPDRATLAYSQRAREAYPESVVIIGGVEASLRRFAHYDYWSDKIKRSIVLDARADFLVYGMGEAPLVEIIQRLQNGEPAQSIRNIRSTAYRLKQAEDLPEETESTIHLPSMEEIEEDNVLFARMTRQIYDNLNPHLNITLVQEHAKEAVVVNPPSLPLSQKELDRIYDLPFTRRPHPIYEENQQKIPAWEMIRNSVQIHRGCFGGCSFCSIAAHQGKFVQSRSKESIIKEIELLTNQDGFTGVVSDIGGPTANMYALTCKNESAAKVCRRVSCLLPECCANLNTDHGELIELMRAARQAKGVRQVLVASGVRTDLALMDGRYIKELVENHVGGHLKTAPEHTNSAVLSMMNKPSFENYLNFCKEFTQYCESAGKEQYLVPYLMAGFPGTTLAITVESAVCLKQHNIKSEQVQEFVPCPGELATCIYFTGVNPMTGDPVFVPKKLRDRRLQKALLMYHKPENYHDIKTALHEARQEQLIGNGSGCLITAYPPKSETLKRTSKIKRLKKQNDQEKQEKTKRREKFELAAADNLKKLITKRNETKPQYKTFDRKESRSPDSRRSDFKRSDSDRSDSRRSDFKRSDSDRSDSRRSDFKRSDSRPSDSRRSDFKRSDSRPSDSRRSDFKRSDSANKGSGKFGNKRRDDSARNFDKRDSNRDQKKHKSRDDNRDN